MEQHDRTRASNAYKRMYAARASCVLTCVCVLCEPSHTIWFINMYKHMYACACRIREAHIVDQKTGSLSVRPGACIQPCALALVDLKSDADAGSMRIRMILLRVRLCVFVLYSKNTICYRNKSLPDA